MSDLTEICARIADLEARLERLPADFDFVAAQTRLDEDTPSSYSPLLINPSAGEWRNVAPFEIVNDTDDGKYKIFAPAGCVLLNGRTVTDTGADEYGWVTLEDEDYDSGAIYCHVCPPDGTTKISDYLLFNGNETNASASYSFKVAKLDPILGQDEYALAQSIVSIGAGGGGSASPGCFEIDGDAFVNPFFRVGQKFYSMTPNHSPSDFVNTPFVALRIAAGANGPDDVSDPAALVGYASYAAMMNDGHDTGHAILPLYWLEFNTGTNPPEASVKCDLRAMPSAIMMEFST